jgi:hypothetical protein
LIAGAYFIIPKGKAGRETFITVSRKQGRKDSKFKIQNFKFQIPKNKLAIRVTLHSSLLTLRGTLHSPSTLHSSRKKKICLPFSGKGN